MATLKASLEGIARIKQARSERGWSVDDFRWIELASEILGVSWHESGILALGISEGTWKRFLAGKYPINAEAFKAYCQVLEINWEEVIELKPNKDKRHRQQRKCQIDWGEAPDISVFYGRDRELETLKQWVMVENCRLLMLLGMGGIGKTALSVKLGQEIIGSSNPFSHTIWRSFRNAPPISELLGELIYFLSRQQETSLPKSLEGKLVIFLKYLRYYRCLIILDNFESILAPGDRSGGYRSGWEGWGQLLQLVAETTHQSCLILTSREKPQRIAKYEGDNLPVRSLQIKGLSELEGRNLLTVKGEFFGTQNQWQLLIARYGGNPLALNIAASWIRDFFDGNIAHFLQLSCQGAFIFDDIRYLLNEQFERLTSLEQEIMYWLAINRETVSLSALNNDLLENIPIPELLESLVSLQRRSLIEKGKNGFIQQPVVMEYSSDRLIEKICAEIANWTIAKDANYQNAKPTILTTHALIKAQAKDYVRDTQINLILQPIIARLIREFRTKEGLSARITEILKTLRAMFPQEKGYAGGNCLNLLHHAQIDIKGFDFSNLRVRQGYFQGVSLQNVNFTNSDLSSCVFTETLGNVLSAAFSPDGQLLATCDTDCHVRVWEVETGRLLLLCEGHQTWVRFVVFSPDGEAIASCASDWTIKLWKVRDGVCFKTLTGHKHEVYALAYSPDGETLASASGDLTVKLWNLKDGKCCQTFKGHHNWVRSVAFSPDGSILASSSADCTIKLWDVTQGRCLRTLTGHGGWVRSVMFSPNGQTLASGSDDGTIKIWNYQTGECLKTYRGHGKNVYSIAYSPDGQILTSGSGDWTIKLWDCHTDTCIKTIQGHTNEVCAVVFNPNGRSLVAVSLDQSVRLWDFDNGQCLKTWYSHTDWAFPVTFSPDGRILATGSNDKTVKLWDWQAGNCIRSLAGHTDFIYSIAFTENGEILASGSTDSSVRLWQANTGQCFQLLLGHADWVFAVAFHPQDRILATASADCSIKLWDINTAQCRKTLEGHTEKIWGIAWSPSGQILASASVDQSLKLWDYSTGECLQTFQQDEGRIFSVTFSPNSQIIAISGANQTVKLWDWQMGKCLQTLVGHTYWVFATAFSPDGLTLASASYDRTVRIWDVKTGKCCHVCTGHEHLVSSIVFHPDGQKIASGSQDQTARIWDVKTGQCLRILRVKKLYEGMKISGVQGLTDATILTLKSLGAIS